jgi:hypothetical protein
MLFPLTTILSVIGLILITLYTLCLRQWMFWLAGVLLSIALILYLLDAPPLVTKQLAPMKCIHLDTRVIHHCRLVA